MVSVIIRFRRASLVREREGPPMAAARVMRGMDVCQVRAREPAHRAPVSMGIQHRREGIMAPTNPAVRVRIIVIRTPEVGFAPANVSMSLNRCQTSLFGPLQRALAIGPDAITADLASIGRSGDPSRA
ncbi:MAG: hypothetical protein ACRDHI_07690 [Actinomycetota bacterium]